MSEQPAAGAVEVPQSVPCRCRSHAAPMAVAMPLQWSGPYPMVVAVPLQCSCPEQLGSPSPGRFWSPCQVRPGRFTSALSELSVTEDPCAV